VIDDGRQIGEARLAAQHWVLGLDQDLLAAHYLCDDHEPIRSQAERFLHRRLDLQEWASHFCRVLGPVADMVRAADMAVVLEGSG
jgi:hypothetical protein